jgi:hypothetical protein
VCVCMKNVPPLKIYQPLIRRTLLLLSPFWFHSFIKKLAWLLTTTLPLFYTTYLHLLIQIKILQVYMMMRKNNPFSSSSYNIPTIHTDITHTHTQYVCPPSVNSEPMMTLITTHNTHTHNNTHTSSHTHSLGFPPELRGSVGSPLNKERKTQTSKHFKVSKLTI